MWRQDLRASAIVDPVMENTDESPVAIQASVIYRIWLLVAAGVSTFLLFVVAADAMGWITIPWLATLSERIGNLLQIVLGLLGLIGFGATIRSDRSSRAPLLSGAVLGVVAAAMVVVLVPGQTAKAPEKTASNGGVAQAATPPSPAPSGSAADALVSPCAELKPQAGEPSRLHSCVRKTLRAGLSLQLSTAETSVGQIGDREAQPNAELYFNKETTGSYLESLDEDEKKRKKIAKLGGAAGFAACQAARLNDEVQPTAAGDVICIHGNSGQLALAFLVSTKDSTVVMDLIVWSVE